MEKELVMSYDDWFAKYKPVKNIIARNSEGYGFEGCMFETFGEELNHVRKTNPKNVWTLLDNEGTWEISSGLRVVNRLGYFITEVPFTGNDNEFLTVSLDEEDGDTT